MEQAGCRLDRSSEAHDLVKEISQTCNRSVTVRPSWTLNGSVVIAAERVCSRTTGGETMKRYLGVDLHRTQFTVCMRVENGRTYLRQWPMKDLRLFAIQLQKEDEIAVKATGNTRLKTASTWSPGARSRP